MTAFAQVEQFIEQSKRAATPRDLDNLLAAVTGELGFDHYALIHHVDLTPMRGDLSHMDEGTLVALTNYPEAWVEQYVARNIVANDPIHLASYRTNVGFRWDQVDQLIRVTSEHRAILDETQRAGIGTGYTIPANVPGEAKGSCTFAMRCGRSLPAANLLMAQMIGVFGFEAARGMVLRSRRFAPTPPPRPLTPRQIDCILLVARGKTDWEISRILGVHEQTVTQHLNEARERCGVSRRAQLIVDALYRGDLSFNDIYGEVPS